MACQAAREVIGATSVTIEIVEPERGTLQQVVTSGREPTGTHPEDPLLEAVVRVVYRCWPSNSPRLNRNYSPLWSNWFSASWRKSSMKKAACVADELEW